MANLGIKKKHRNKYQLAAQAEIDLHGFTKTEARNEIINFINIAREKKFKKIRIITGKGLHSESGKSILRECAINIIKKEGFRYSDAKLFEGGSGAIDIYMD